jgi:hypothetical protein
MSHRVCPCVSLCLTAHTVGGTHRDAMRAVLNLPSNTVVDFKPHSRHLPAPGGGSGAGGGGGGFFRSADRQPR